MFAADASNGRRVGPRVLPWERTAGSSCICPCPMDYLSALVVEAVETVDRRRDDRERDRDFLADQSDWRPADIEEVRRAYEEARGSWTGCDWHTQFGDSGRDLNGLTPTDAEN